MKKIKQTVEQRLADILSSYIKLLFDISQMDEQAGPPLTRMVASANHMLNVALAMARRTETA